MKKILFGLMIGTLALFFFSCSIPIKIPETLDLDFEITKENVRFETTTVNNNEWTEYQFESEVKNPLIEAEIPFDAKLKKIELTVTATVNKPADFEPFDYKIYISRSGYSTEPSDLAIEGTMKPGTTEKTVNSKDYGGIENLRTFLVSDEEEATFYAVVKHNYNFEETEDVEVEGQLSIEGTVYVGF
ncbi:MAG: hypothetical protein FXF54_02955 [Kosmotoga sp.]|nr:MAG: hypothetical protein FXF54_02955 [Kosmotoga sp.]